MKNILINTLLIIFLNIFVSDLPCHAKSHVLTNAELRKIQAGFFPETKNISQQDDIPVEQKNPLNIDYLSNGYDNPSLTTIISCLTATHSTVTIQINFSFILGGIKPIPINQINQADITHY